VVEDVAALPGAVDVDPGVVARWGRCTCPAECAHGSSGGCCSAWTPTRRDEPVPSLSPAAWDDPEVARLTADQQLEMRALYDGDIEPGVKPSAADIAVVLLARDDDGTPLGCGALRPLGPGEAEVKRMYVVPAARGRGISRLVLTGLEAEAAARGWTTLKLETGNRQPAAVGLYTSTGYRPIEAFGHYVDDDTDDSLYFARTLA